MRAQLERLLSKDSPGGIREPRHSYIDSRLQDVRTIGRNLQGGEGQLQRVDAGGQVEQRVHDIHGGHHLLDTHTVLRGLLHAHGGSSENQGATVLG